MNPLLPALILCSIAATAALAAPSATYSISGVADNDTLNIRAQPNPHAATIGSIPANAHGITATGQQQQAGNSVWREIRYQSTQGWVNSHYLSAETTALFHEPLHCSGTEPFWGLEIDQQARFSTPEQSYRPMRADPAQQAANRPDTWSLIFQPAETTVPAFAFIQQTQQCSDGMSDTLYRYQIQLRIGGQTYSGCCNPL
jgi:uncharacterized membrane protein